MKKDQKDRLKKRAANLQKQHKRQTKKKARLEKKQNKARKRKRKERAKKRLTKREFNSERVSELFLIKAEGEAMEEKRDHLSKEIVPKLEVKRELGESFLIRSVDDNDEFVEEEKENITPISSVDNYVDNFSIPNSS